MHLLPCVNTSPDQSCAKFRAGNKEANKLPWRDRYVKDEKQYYSDSDQKQDWPKDGLNQRAW